MRWWEWILSVYGVVGVATTEYLLRSYWQARHALSFRWRWFNEQSWSRTAYVLVACITMGIIWFYVVGSPLVQRLVDRILHPKDPADEQALIEQLLYRKWLEDNGIAPPPETGATPEEQGDFYLPHYP